MTTYEDSCTALAVALSAGVPVLLWGGPGVGKTSVVEQVALGLGWHLETVIASICDPTDFKGMPRDAGDRTTFSPPEWAVRVAEAGQCPNRLVNVLLARLIADHHDRHGPLLPVGLEPNPDAIAKHELIEPPPPTGNLDLRFRHQIPGFCQLVPFDQ